MRLSIIDIDDVTQDIDTNGVPINFNTNFHTAKEAPDLPIPSEKPYSFSRWLPLILQSRDIPETALQIVSLKRSQVDVLVHAARACIHTRQPSLSYAEDLREEVSPAFEKLVFPPEGLFLRLGACSPKDGVSMTPGKITLHSADEIILRLTTSQRAWSALSNFLNTDAEEVRMFFLPFDGRMRTEAEYRVFCVPESLKITAVSQYKWHKPWMFAHQPRAEMEETARSILAGIEAVHGQIISLLHPPGEDELDDQLRRQGFTFDVLHVEDQRFALIELNTFGVRSACGSCLFHWVKDRQLIYGLDSPAVEFRVAC
jgi:hypothetical protein